MPSEVGYYRHPTIHGDSIVFVCEDDLWSMPAEGGIARRLTANPGTVSFPSFSPDGTRIAFTGKDEGPLDVYVMDADGGAARRLTWLGGATRRRGLESGRQGHHLRERLATAVPRALPPLRGSRRGRDAEAASGGPGAGLLPRTRW